MSFMMEDSGSSDSMASTQSRTRAVSESGTMPFVHRTCSGIRATFTVLPDGRVSIVGR